MAHPERFERPTPRFVVWCSIQLSYGCGCKWLSRLRGDPLKRPPGESKWFLETMPNFPEPDLETAESA